VFRDPVRAYIQYDPNAGGSNYQYTSMFNQQADSFGGVSSPASFLIGSTNGNRIPYTPSYYSSFSSYSPHGPRLYMGSTGEAPDRFVWMDKGAIMLFRGFFSGPTNLITVYPKTYVMDSINDLPPFTVSSTNVTFMAASNAYYAFDVSTISGASVSTALASDIEGTTSVFAHHPVPGFEANYMAADNIRINAVSVMYSNQAAPLNSEGSIVGYQCPQGTHWIDYIVAGGSSSFSISNRQGSSRMKLATGMYGFLKPTQPSDFAMLEDYEVSLGLILDSSFRLDHQSDFLLLYQNAAVPEGRDGYITLAYGLEYGTTDVWRVRATPNANEAAYREAMAIVKGLPQWHENPLHWKDIWGGIKSAGRTIANGIIEYGPTAMQMSKMLLGAL